MYQMPAMLKKQMFCILTLYDFTCYLNTRTDFPQNVSCIKKNVFLYSYERENDVCSFEVLFNYESNKIIFTNSTTVEG